MCEGGGFLEGVGVVGRSGVVGRGLGCVRGGGSWKGVWVQICLKGSCGLLGEVSCSCSNKLELNILFLV